MKLFFFIFTFLITNSLAVKFVSPDSILVSGHDTLFRAETQMRFDRFPLNFANENFPNDSLKRTYTYTQGGVAMHLSCKTPWLDLEFVDRSEGAQINRFAVNSICNDQVDRFSDQKFRIESCDSTSYKDFEVWLPSTWAVDLWSVKIPDNAECKLPQVLQKPTVALLGGVHMGSVVDTLDGTGAGYDLLSSQLSRLTHTKFLNKAMTNTAITINNYKSIPDSIQEIFIYWGYSNIWNGSTPSSITQYLTDLIENLYKQNPSRIIHLTSWHNLSTTWRERILDRSKHTYDEYQTIFPNIQKKFMWEYSGQLYFHDTQNLIDTTCTSADKYNCDLAAGAFLTNKGTQKIAQRIAKSWDSLKATPRTHNLSYSSTINLREGVAGQIHSLPDSIQNQEVEWRLVHGPIDLSLTQNNDLVFSNKRISDNQQTTQAVTLALSDGYFVDTLDLQILTTKNAPPQITLDSGQSTYRELPRTFVQSKFSATDLDNDSLVWVIQNTPWLEWHKDTTQLDSLSMQPNYKVLTSATLPKGPGAWDIKIGATDLIDTTWINWRLITDESVSENTEWTDILGRKKPCSTSRCTRGVSIKKNKILLRAY
ncbi:hypothetical protein OAU52_00950 [bacterium]|nr:hypothetical protein [bacterium]